MTVAKPLAVSTETTPDRQITHAKLALIGPLELPFRVLNTVYQNLTGGILIVIAEITLHVENSVNEQCIATISGVIGVDDPPNDISFSETLIRENISTNPLTVVRQMFFIVPPDQFYEFVDTVSGTGSTADLGEVKEISI